MCSRKGQGVKDLDGARDPGYHQRQIMDVLGLVYSIRQLHVSVSRPEQEFARFHLRTKSREQEVKTHLQAYNILYAVIPGGLTSCLQLCDYGVFKPLKELLSNLFDNWKDHRPHSYTAVGNVRPVAFHIRRLDQGRVVGE